MTIRVSYPMKSMCDVSWGEDDEFSPVFMRFLERLEAVPGVEVNDGHIRLPHTVWSLDAFEGLLASINQKHLFTPPTLPESSLLDSLYPHQREAVYFLWSRDGGLCADQMGLGKTRTALVAGELLAQRHTKNPPRLIVAPLYTRAVWLRELLASGVIDNEDDFAFAEGKDPETQDFNFDARWWFIHYDIAHEWQNRLIVTPRGRPVVTVVDEAHWVKNGRARRSKAVGVLAGVSKYRILLTGTPMPNRPGELWWPLTVLDGVRTWGSPVDFRVRYAGAFHDGYGYKDTGASNVDELQTRLQSRYIRRELDDAGVVLPAFTRQKLDVTLSDDVRSKQEAVLENVDMVRLVRMLLSNQMGEETLRVLMKLRKLTTRAKLSSTVDYCTNALEQDESVVVFTWSRQSAEAIAKKVHAWAVMNIGASDGRIIEFCHGGVPQEYRDRLVDYFQESGGVLTATLDSLKEGVTLTKARFLVLHDLSWVPADILQAEARIHRIGQDKPTTAVWSIAQGSVDEIIARAFVTKAADIDATLGLHGAQEAAEQLGLAAFVQNDFEDAVTSMFANWIGRQQ